MSDELDANQLYREYAGFVGRIIRRLTGEGPHVDDLLQEVFLAAHCSRRFEGRSRVETWLYSIAANLCRKHLRTQSRFLRLRKRLAREPEAPPATPSDKLRELELAAHVDRWLSKLTFEQREVIVLYELEAREGSEIAELIGVPIGTVWTRLHHARRRLEKIMRRDATRHR